MVAPKVAAVEIVVFVVVAGTLVFVVGIDAVSELELE